MAFWTSYPRTPKMAKRRAAWMGTRSGARPGFARMGTAAGGGGAWRRTRGRTAGRFRKVGYWGRYKGAGGRGDGELKFHDIDWDEAVADMSAGVISNVSSLVLIGQGITESTRIGRKAVIHSIGWRGKLNLEAVAGTVTGAPQTIRLMLVQDTQCNGAAPAVSTDSGVLETASYQSFNNLSNKGRFKTLFDKTIAMNPMAGAGNGTANDTAPVDRNFTFFKKCRIPIEYSGVANPSVITEVRTNNIFGIMIINNTFSGTNLQSKFRFRFSDG